MNSEPSLHENSLQLTQHILRQSKHIFLQVTKRFEHIALECLNICEPLLQICYFRTQSSVLIRQLLHSLMGLHHTG